MININDNKYLLYSSFSFYKRECVGVAPMRNSCLKVFTFPLLNVNGLSLGLNSWELY